MTYSSRNPNKPQYFGRIPLLPKNKNLLVIFTRNLNMSLYITLWVFGYESSSGSVTVITESKLLCGCFLAWQEPEAKGFQEHVKKIQSPLLLDLRIEVCYIWWYFLTFHENAEIRLLTPTQTILDGVLFMYALTNTNIVRILFFKTKLKIILWGKPKIFSTQGS